MVKSLFSYSQKKTKLHSLNPGIKLLILLILCIITFCVPVENKFNFCITVVIPFFITLVIFILGGANFSSLKKMKFIFFIGFLVTIFSSFSINLSFVNKDEYDSCLFNFLLIKKSGLFYGLFYTIRFFITCLAANIIFETTSFLEITDFIEKVQNVVAKVFPVLNRTDIAVILSMAINFIPDIFETWNRIEKAAKSRMGNKKVSFVLYVFIIEKRFEALLSCLLFKAENKRKALINRGRIK